MLRQKLMMRCQKVGLGNSFLLSQRPFFPRLETTRKKEEWKLSIAEEQKRSLCRAVSLEETLGRKANKQGKAFSTAKKKCQSSHPPCCSTHVYCTPFCVSSLTSASFAFPQGQQPFPGSRQAGYFYYNYGTVTTAFFYRWNAVLLMFLHSVLLWLLPALWNNSVQLWCVAK